MKTTLEKKPACQVVISGTLPVADIDKHYAKALDSIVKEVELPGFRRGKVPKERVLQEVGERSVWRTAAEATLREEVADILKEHTVVPMLPPEISFTVTEAQQEVPFTILVTTPPKVEIKDFKKSGEDALKKLEKLDDEKERTQARKSLEAQTRTMLQITEERALTEEEAKKLGFENQKALDHFLGEEATRAVESYDNQRKRGAVAEALIKGAEIEAPVLMIDEEANAMLETAKQEIARQGMPFNEYLDKRGITEAEMLTELRPQAEKRLSLDLVFAKIAQSEQLKPDEEEIHRVAHAVMHQGVPSDRAHQYGAEVSIREAVWGIFGLATPRPPKKENPEPEPEPENQNPA